MITQPGVHLLGGEMPNGIGRSVQLYIDSKPYIAVGPISHGELLERILNATLTSFQMDEGDGKQQCPRLDGESYHVDGMSMAYVNQGPIRLYGLSKRFRLGPSQQHLDDVAEYCNGQTPYIG